jgi:very-short-patch-repair endonuclease
MTRKIVYNQPEMKLRRQDLRKNQSDGEKLLWSKIKSGVSGFRIKRQYSVGHYVLDFYCPKKKLAIELDGSQHKLVANRQYDIYRTQYLHSLGIKEIRFWNSEILYRVDEVLEVISKSINPPLTKGRAG